MMADANRGGYAAQLPSAVEGSSVQYYFVARSTSQGTSHLPIYGPYEVFEYTIAGEQGSGATVVVMPMLILLIVVVVLAYVYRQRLKPMARKGLRVVGLRKDPDE